MAQHIALSVKTTAYSVNTTSTDKQSPNRSGRFSTGLLLVGAAIGALLAATGLFQSAAGSGSLQGQDDVLAEVNGWTIQRSDFDRFAASLELGKQNELGEVEKQNLLDRMIEEKLLLQRGLELGLVENDAAVRKAISAAMIQTITAEVSAIEPDQQDLEDFYRRNANYFARPARLRVQQLLFLHKGDSKSAYQRASDAYRALENGVQPAKVQTDFADKAVLEVPKVLLPPHKLRDYVGPKLLDLAMGMQAGQVSRPQAQQSAYSILIVHDNQPQANVPLSTVRDRVLSEYQRRAGEQALREYLSMLRAEADILVSPAIGNPQL